ncbi:MAG: EamA family transporter [Oscillospiraceae bacterium]|nr:EamA family transporter [Oscillospiraceae bacterium]
MMMYILILPMTIISSFAAFLLKKATTNNISLVHLLKNKFFYFGGFLYFLAMVANIFVLKVVPLSVSMPLGTITYVWTLIISNKFLNEKITKKKLLGVFFIFLGCAIIGIFSINK